MIINIVLLSLITIRATGIKLKASIEPSSSQTIAPEEDFITAFSSRTTPTKPTRRPEPSIDDEPFFREPEYIPIDYFHMQYAPLPERFEKNAGMRQTTKVIAVNVAHTEHPPGTYPEETLLKTDMKSNVAPYFDVQRQSYRSFVPGYNVKVLQSVNRNPGYNAMYQTYPELFEKKKKYKITFMGENVETHKPEHLVTQAIPSLKPHSFIVPSKNFIFKPSLFNVGVAETVEKIEAQKTPLFSKIRRIHLNLARVYSQGVGIPKLPTHDKDYSMNIRPRKKSVLPSLYPEAFDRVA